MRAGGTRGLPTAAAIRTATRTTAETPSASGSTGGSAADGGVGGCGAHRNGSHRSVAEEQVKGDRDAEGHDHHAQRCRGDLGGHAGAEEAAEEAGRRGDADTEPGNRAE